MMIYFQLDLEEQISMKFAGKCKDFPIGIHENAFENVVCETAVILSRE